MPIHNVLVTTFLSLVLANLLAMPAHIGILRGGG